jgi:hypothetical protein
VFRFPLILPGSYGSDCNFSIIDVPWADIEVERNDSMPKISLSLFEALIFSLLKHLHRRGRFNTTLKDKNA